MKGLHFECMHVASCTHYRLLVGSLKPTECLSAMCDDDDGCLHDAFLHFKVLNVIML